MLYFSVLSVIVATLAIPSLTLCVGKETLKGEFRECALKIVCESADADPPVAARDQSLRPRLYDDISHK